MPLTPDDIANFPLRTTVRGYATQQVDALLDEVADDLERLQRENADLRRRLQEMEREMESLAETEATLKRTLVTAQRAAEQTLAEARDRAAAIRAEAEQEMERARNESLHEARSAEEDLRRRRDQLAAEIDALHTFESTLRGQLRDVLESQLAALDQLHVELPPRPEASEAPPSGEQEGRGTLEGNVPAVRDRPAGGDSAGAEAAGAASEDTAPGVDDQLFDTPRRRGRG